MVALSLLKLRIPASDQMRLQRPLRNNIGVRPNVWFSGTVCRVPKK